MKETLKQNAKEFLIGVKKVFVFVLIAYFIGFGFTFGASTFLKYDRVIGDSFIAITHIELED
ncbi:TMhelix containing protein [Vibrio phage 1.201.B._10N.286.55.F1]|nr:TMhelix containing protein [Vibrio phage 1.201.B._10N.286.55.F1]